MTDTGDQAAELAALRERLTLVRRERMSAQRDTAVRRSVELALAAVGRDRDASSAPRVDELRERGQQLTDRLLELCWSVDWRRLLLARLDANGVNVAELPGYDEFVADLGADAAWRAELNRKLDDAGVALSVPAALAPDVPAHPDRDRRAAMFADQAVREADWEARTATPTRRRPDGTTHGAG